MADVKYINHNQLQRSLLLCQAANVPVCIIGGVGCGKTTAVEDFVKKIDAQMEATYHCWKVFLGLVDATDIGGIPIRTDDNRILYAPPSCLPFNTEKAGVILGDEYDRSPPEVQNAFNQILLGGEIHGNKISPNAFVVLTMNGSSDKYTTGLSEATRTRMCTLFLSSKAASSLQDWEKWAKENGVNPTIQGFARFRNDLIESHEQFEEQAMLTARTRDMAGRILDAAEKAPYKTEDIMMPVLAGVIGMAGAVELMQYQRMEKELPDIQSMLKNPEKYELDKVWEEHSRCYAVGIAIQNAINGDYDLAEGAVKLISYMPNEIAAWAIRGITSECPEVMTSESYQEFFEKIKKLIV